jgi:HlyD family secretion protein
MDTDCIVDAFPGEIFRGKISQVRFSPNNVSGVVTYSAVVDVDNPDEKLRPGMTTTITVHTHEAHGVSRIPNAALRYRPTPPLGPDGKPILQAPEPALPKGQARVWTLTSDKPGDEKDEMRIVTVGITDGIFTEVTDSALALGARVVTDETDADDKKKKRIF